MMAELVTTEIFKNRCIEKFGDVLTFEKTQYKTCVAPVCVTCKIHGDFDVIPGEFLKQRNKVYCYRCYLQEQFIEKSKKKFGDSLDYSLVNYVDWQTKVKLICKDHGAFEITPVKHLNRSKYPCPKCKPKFEPISKKDLTERFIAKSKSKYGNVLDYSKVKYVNGHTQVTFICKEHGEFSITPDSHLKNGFACSKCHSLKCRKQDFIKKAREKFGDKFDYNEIIYFDGFTNITLQCKDHGDFQQTPQRHLSCKVPCPKCRSVQTHSTEEFIEKSREKFGDYLDYSKAVYSGYNSNICLICPTHGEFYQTYNTHISAKYPCPKCNPIRYDTDTFIQESIARFGNVLDYSKVKYVNSETPIILICKEHGEFNTYPFRHLRSVHPCKICSKKNLTQNTFIKKSKEKFGEFLDYSKVEYVDLKTPVCLICPIHGEFFARPCDNLKYNNPCHQCASNTLTKELFIQKAIEKHGNKFDYSKVNFKINSENICIGCPIHGEFETTPRSHLLSAFSCPKCSRNVSGGEMEWLDSLNINNRQVTIKIGKKRFNVDGFDPGTNTVYEYNGDFWHGNPKYYNPKDINTGNKKTFGELYQKTLNKEKELVDAGYKVVSIWESDFVDNFVP